jgi:very-short-patch-repair endonuclease
MEARSGGITVSALRWGEATGRWRRAERGVYAEGPEPLTELDVARARVLAARTVAGGRLAAVLYELDGVTFREIPRRRRGVPEGQRVRLKGITCTDPLRTMVDLASEVDDLTWEQALECALRKRLVTVAAIEDAIPELTRGRVSGTARIRRVLTLRPADAPATESLLETLIVQLIRTIPHVPEPVRQHVVRNLHGDFVARVDLCWPDLGAFLELDGQQHRDQPVYDAMRETAVVAKTGWLPARMTWHEVVFLPRTTGRRLASIAHQARRRPLGGGILS